ncbi:MAG: electron transfer flavoprotein subunit beta/FixA family protein [bacterium]
MVCLKQVPDTELSLRITEGGKDIERSDLNYVVNPYDEYAIEEALRIREELPGGVTLVAVGPDRYEEALRAGLAMGADRAIHVKDEAIEGSDPLVTAYILSKVICGLGYDLILCGKQAIEDDSSIVGPALAEYLGLPQVTVVTKLELTDDGKKAVAHREVEGGIEVVETSLPAVITAQKGLNEPRYASLRGMMKAKRMPVEVKTVRELDVSSEEVGKAGSRTELLELTYPAKRSAGRILEGELPDVVKELVRCLREEARVL